MTLLDTHPQRFGWRIWDALSGPDQWRGRLIGPWSGTMLTGRTFDATCHHDHQAPAKDCTCGVHYWPGVWQTDAYNESAQAAPQVMTFGAAIGPIEYDFDPPPYQRDSLRTSRYYLLAILLPAELETLAPLIRSRHHVPTFVGKTPAQCQAAERVLAPDCGPAWFDKIARLPADPETRSTRQYNATMANVLLRSGYKPKRLADHIRPRNTYAQFSGRSHFNA